MNDNILNFLKAGHEHFSIKEITHFRDGNRCCQGMGTMVIICSNGNEFTFDGVDFKVKKWIWIENNDGVVVNKKKPVIDAIFKDFVVHQLGNFIDEIEYKLQSSKALFSELTKTTWI